MARRKQAAPVAEETAPVINAEDTINEEKQRIADERTSEFLGEQVVDNKVVEDKTPAPTPKKEEPDLKAEDIEKEIEIDPEAMKREIADTVRKETADKITQALTGKQETTQEERDRYEVIAENFAKEKGRNPTWFELVKFIKEDIREEMKNETEKERVEREEVVKQQKEENAKKQKAFDTYVDEQLDELHNAGKINKNDEKSRQALFRTMLEVNEKRVKEGKAPIYSVKEIFYEHYTAPTTQPAGFDAPISAGRGNAQISNEEEYSYGDVHNPKSFVDLFRKR